MVDEVEFIYNLLRNSRINFTVSSTSFTLTTLIGVWMYLEPLDNVAVAIPSLVRCIAVASVVPPSPTSIDIGGVNIGLNQPVGHIISKINLGGTNSNNNYQNVSATEFKGNNFDSSSNRVELNSNIQMGGVNIN